MDFGDSNITFPIKVENKFIIVELKTDNLFLRNTNGEEIKSKLEIVLNGNTFIIPWEGKVKVGKKVNNENNSLKEKIELSRELITKNINDESEEIEEENEVMVEEENFDDFINTPVEEIIYTKDELTERKEVNERFSDMLNISMDDLIKKMGDKNEI